MLYLMKSLAYSPRQVYTIAIVVILLLGLVLLFTPHHALTPKLEQALELPEPLAPGDDAEDGADWQEIQTRPGDSLSSLFSRMGLSPQTLHLIMDKNPHAKTLTQIKPNQTIKFLIEGTSLKQLILPISDTKSLTITEKDSQFETKVETLKTFVKPEVVHATVEHSLYLAAKEAHIPYSLIRQMTEILSWQMNFSRDVRKGDSFTIRYEAHYIDKKRIKTGDILAISYHHQGKTYRAIRHQTASGHTDYFTPEGKSVRKAFTRYPIRFSHISSNFNLKRMHPILKRVRPHRGIDLAAPIGTPIHATSDGRISTIGYDSGYGNKIKIRHAGPYTSVYAHLLKFKKGLKHGDYVQKGDIIGYVGQTGLADGPHCHYEFRVNDIPHNPATIKLPDASPIPTAELAAFQAQANIIVAELESNTNEKTA